MNNANQLNLMSEQLPRHVAVIMDGNGRWAQSRGLPRTMGHRQGVAALEKVVERASSLGIEALTVYAFSTENWKRAQDEVSFLMNLLIEFAKKKLERMHRQGLQINILGDVYGLPREACAAMLEIAEITKNNTGMKFNIAINYGGRQELVLAAQKLAQRAVAGEITPAEINAAELEKCLYTAGLPEVDLLIRTSGEYRISNYLLWQIAYSELYYTQVLWPDFDSQQFDLAILDYAARERRFGGLCEK